MSTTLGAFDEISNEETRMAFPKRMTLSRSVLVATGCLFLIVYACCNKDKVTITVPDVLPTTTTTSPALTANPIKSRSLLLGDGEDEEALVEKIRNKIRPVPLQFDTVTVTVGDVETTKTALKAHQVLHMHQMKTGGTSIDHLLKCAMDRMMKDLGWVVPYYSIHECSRSRFAQCLTNSTYPCRKSMAEASIMSYCSALKYLETFGWWDETKNANQNFRALTVLRHPVDRVWSMFRFQTKRCYKCTPLLDIYEKMESGDTAGFDSLCLAQLQNHQVANLLSSTDWPVMPESQNVDDAMQHAMVVEAIENLKTFFTVVGLTEDLPTTARLLGQVFPFLNTTLDDPTFLVGMGNQTGPLRACPLPHANASPSNNRCIPGGADSVSTHWDLPDHPDEATTAAILKHNPMDMALYEAAVQYFELQKRAMDSGEEEV